MEILLISAILFGLLFAFCGLKVIDIYDKTKQNKTTNSTGIADIAISSKHSHNSVGEKIA